MYSMVACCKAQSWLSNVCVAVCGETWASGSGATRLFRPERMSITIEALMIVCVLWLRV